MDKETETEALKAYLAGHFSHAEIRQVGAFDRDGSGRSFLIEADGVEYCLNIMDEAVAGLDRDGFIQLLEDNRVAAVMLDLVGFPVTVTVSGCIFD